MNSLEKSKFSFRDEEKIKVRKTTWNSLSLYILSNQILFYLVSLPSKWQKRFVRIASLQFTRHISMSKVFFLSLFPDWNLVFSTLRDLTCLPVSQPALRRVTIPAQHVLLPILSFPDFFPKHTHVWKYPYGTNLTSVKGVAVAVRSTRQAKKILQSVSKPEQAKVDPHVCNGVRVFVHIWLWGREGNGFGKSWQILLD